jgi:glutamate N-acetyltransferase/amino-acid N-acetyltransferase
MAVNLQPPTRLLPVPGIRLAAGSAGIYRIARPDLVLMELGAGTAAAAVFTRNAFSAAPVQVARRHIGERPPRFCLINAGNANAGTGARGIEDTLATCRAVAQAGGCRAEEVLPFSTGVIGEYLPSAAIGSAVPALHAGLSEDAWLDCARAIMTTDTVPKGSSRQVEVDGGTVTVTGIAKGAGMIHPQMATMLAFIATDALIANDEVSALLNEAVAASFNAICVDGDTSTNDAVLFAATGCSGRRTGIGRAPCRIRDAVFEVCVDLARSVIRDAEGATKFITVRVEQGADRVECARVANAVATSPLVKTAFHASDPNWGRILAAVGRAGIEGLDVSRVGIFLGGVCIVEHGARAPSYTEQAGREVMAGDEIDVLIVLGRGTEGAHVWTCDLSCEYVRINAEYRT